MQEFDPHVLEEKPIPPPEEFSKKAHVGSLEEYRKMYDRRAGRSRSLLGRTGQAPALVRSPAESPGMETAPREMVRRRQAKRLLQLRGPPSAKRTPISPPSCGKPKTARPSSSPLPSCTNASARFANVLESLGVKPGDCIAIYMPMIPELAIAMLAMRAHRRRAFRGFRRVQRHGAGRPHRRRKSQGADHRRRRIPPRKNRSAQGNRRCGFENLPDESKNASSCGARRNKSAGRKVVTSGGTI